MAEKGKRKSKVKEIVKRGGTSIAKKMKERRAKGAMISFATAAAAGYWEGGTNITDRVLWKPKPSETPSNKDIYKTDAIGLAAGAFAFWSGNGLAYDVAMGLLPVTIHRMVMSRTIRGEAGRPPKVEGVQGLEDDTMSGAVSLMGDEDEISGMAGYDQELGAVVEVQED